MAFPPTQPNSDCKIPKLVEFKLKCHFLLKPGLPLGGKISCPPLISAPIALCIKLYYSYYALITLRCNLSVYVSVYFHQHMQPRRVKIRSCSSLCFHCSAQCWHNSHLKYVSVSLLLKKCMPGEKKFKTAQLRIKREVRSCHSTMQKIIPSSQEKSLLKILNNAKPWMHCLHSTPANQHGSESRHTGRMTEA